MPIYEYQCEQCGTRTEALQKLNDPPLTVCEKCGGNLKRLISAPAVQFKGTGWYVTDYAKKSGGAAAGSSKGDKGEKSESSGAGEKGGGDKADKPSDSGGGDKGSSTSTSSTPSGGSGSSSGGSGGGSTGGSSAT